MDSNPDVGGRAMTTRWAAIAAVMVGCLWTGPALGGPPAPAPAPEIEIVPQFPEGQIRVVLPGREGDEVFVDGWSAGKLPVVTELAEGLHRFRVEGAAGKVEREVYVTVKPKEVLEIDLTVPAPEDAAPNNVVPDNAAPKPKDPPKP
jgi:hypothetical protein